MSYSGPTLESLQDEWLDPQCMAALGDAIQYKPAGGSFAPLRAYVDYGEALREIETGKIIDQEIGVEMLMADAAEKPSGACRVMLGRLPGLIFKPVNVMIGRSGTHWAFGVVRVNG